MTGPAPLGGLDVEAVENVFVFVADALRWDALPDRVADRGLSVETVASALATPQAMPSLVTGLHAPRHGVTWFNHSLPGQVETVFDYEGVDGRFVDSKLRRPLEDLLGDPSEGDVTTAEPPFVAVELDHGGHVPYPDMPDATPAETFTALSRDPEAVRRHYEAGVAESVDRFERRLEQLSERGLLGETLVVFTSDHGELLGEHGGIVGHGLPPAPELVYVPTTFVHPSLPAGERGDALAHHVDLVPTVADVLGLRPPHDLDGRSLLAPVPPDRPAYVNCTVHPPYRWQDTPLDPAYRAPSVWTADGGHVFARSRFPKRLLTAAYEGLLSGYTAAYNSDRSRIRTLVSTLGTYLPRTRTYGTPSIDRERAREHCTAVADRDVEADPSELSAETRTHLEDLGYV